MKTKLSLSITVLSLAIVLLTAVNAFAQFTVRSGGGIWSSTSTWNGGVVPSNWSNATANVSLGNVTLNSSTTTLNQFTVNVSGGRTVTSGTSSVPNNLSMSQTTINLNSGTLVVYGDLTLNDTDININSGSLIVTGTLTINYSSTVTVGAGRNLTAGNIVISNNNDAILTNNGTVTVNNSITNGGVVNNNNGATMNVAGNFNLVNSSSSVFNATGNLTVEGNMALPGSAKMYVLPSASGTSIVKGNVTVSGNENLIVGTNVAPPPYASMAIAGDLISTSSGDITINRNGRFAVFGDMTGSGGDVRFTVNSGGQAYVEGNMTITGGGGNSITNNNATTPYGLYVDGTVSNATGGSSTTANRANTPVMQATNNPFYTWIQSLRNGPLPVTLIEFKVNGIFNTGIQLTWTTSLEKDFSHFELERASANHPFVSIVSIDGEGEGSVETTYHFNDNAPVAGTNYYRLKSVDVDGSVEYSGIISADWAYASFHTSVYPNVVTNKTFTVSLDDTQQVPARLVLMDVSGKEILREQLTDHTTDVSVPESATAGVYLVRLSSASGQETIRIVIR